MVKPNITGMSLLQYLKLREDQLEARKISIDAYNKNYLPAWGDKIYTEDDLKQLDEDLKEIHFVVAALAEFKKGTLKYTPINRARCSFEFR